MTLLFLIAVFAALGFLGYHLTGKLDHFLETSCQISENLQEEEQEESDEEAWKKAAADDILLRNQVLGGSSWDSSQRRRNRCTERLVRRVGHSKGDS
ncbi:MAG: hypothetical protein ACI4F3_06620 [Enterocloster sp.]